MKTLIKFIILAYVLAYVMYPDMQDDLLLWGEIALFASVIFLLVAYFWLAPKNIMFTFLTENRVMYIMTGNGKKWTGRYIFSSTVKYVNPENYDLEEITPYTDKKMYKKSSFFGMAYLGLPKFHSIKYFHVVWQEWKKVGDSFKLITRDELTPYLFVKRFAYGAILKNAESKDGFPLDIPLVFYIEPTNVRKPTFGSDDAIGQIYSLVLGLAGIYVKTHDFASILGEKRTLTDASKVHSGFSAFIRGLNLQIPGEEDGSNLSTIFGYEIKGANILDAEPSGSEKVEVAKANMKIGIAKLNKQALIIDAEARVEARDLDTESLEKYYDALTKNKGAVEIEISKNMFGPNSKLTTLVTNGNTVTNIPLGGKKGDGDE